MTMLQKPDKQYELIPYKGKTDGRIIAHLGYNDKEEPIYIDLGNKTHLVVAGIKGSGKTTLLHDIICSVIRIYSDETVQFILTTGEKSGFSHYKNVPNVLGIGALQDERVLSFLKDIKAEIERRQKLLQYGDKDQFKHLFFVMDGFHGLTVMTRIKAIQYLNTVVNKGSDVNVHLIVSLEDDHAFLPLNLMINSIPNRIVFASPQNTSERMLQSKAASSIIRTGEAYARFTDSPMLHFYSAKASVHDTVQPFNAQEQKIRQQEREKHGNQQAQQKQFDQLDPYQFEEYVAKRMRDNGFTKVQVTPKSGDYGADVLGIDPSGRKVCVQCKKYTGKVGFDAVQQINTARTLFQCDRALLVTTAGLTQQAKETAKKLKVEVLERFNAGSVIQ